MFRNITLFRFPRTLVNKDFLALLDKGTAECPLKPVGPLEMSSRGFVPFNPREDSEIDQVPYYLDNNTIFLTVAGEDKILPASAVNGELKKKIDAFEKSQGRKPGGRTRKIMKEELVHEMLPKALVKPSRVNGYLDLKRGIVVVDTSSRKVGEMFVSEIRHALGSFPALPLNAEVAPRSIMTGWIAGEPLPEGFTLGYDAELRDAMDHGAVAKLSNQDLQSDEIAKHLESGKQVARLGLYFDDDTAIFSLGEDLVLRKFSLGSAALDKLEDTEREDLSAEIDARAFLLTEEFGRVFDVLETALKISKAEGEGA